MSLPLKPYTLVFDERPQYLYAQVRCDTISPEIASDYLNDILNECRELRYERLMIERDIPVRLSTAKLPMLASEFAKMGLEGLKIAFVDKRINNLSLMRLVAGTTRRLGINVRVYRNRPEARRWLLYGDMDTEPGSLDA